MDNHVPAVYADGAKRPSRFHVVGEREVFNDELVLMVADMMSREALMQRTSYHEYRPGHDLRYALDGSKLAALGWSPPVSLEASVKKTVDWSLQHPEWMA
jgi:dTDP-glucose 4,6-dehydratase